MTLLSILLISLNLHLGSDTTKVVKHSCCKTKQLTKACAGMLSPIDTTKTTCNKPKKNCCKTKSPK